MHVTKDDLGLHLERETFDYTFIDNKEPVHTIFHAVKTITKVMLSLLKLSLLSVCPTPVQSEKLRQLTSISLGRKSKCIQYYVMFLGVNLDPKYQEIYVILIKMLFVKFL